METASSLKAFVHAAETRNFTLAGRQLAISASAVGKAIARLEAHLGVRLLHRSTRTISITPEGAMFLERCRRILAELEAAEAELAQTREAPRGRLRVSLPLLGVVMMPTLTAFMLTYPEVQLDLDFSDRLVEVIEEGFDAVLRAGEVSDSRLMGRIVGEFRLRLFASPQYLARRGVPETPEDLAAHACLLHRYATSGKFEPWPFRRNGRERDGPLNVAAVANTIEPLITMAEQGLGIACLPDLAIQRQLAEGLLVPVLDAHVQHSGPFRILWPANRYMSPKLRVFVDFMADRLFARSKTIRA